MNTRTAPGRFIYSVGEWPDVPIGNIPQSDVNFSRRKNAILGLAAGRTYRSLNNEFKIAPKELNRHIERCQLMHEDGRIWGFRALFQNIRIEGFERSADADSSKLRIGRGASGLFKKLLDEQPKLATLIEQQARQHRRAIQSGRRSGLQTLHHDFIVKCRDLLNNDDSKYPLCLRTRAFQGYVDALNRELARLEERNDASLSSSSRTVIYRAVPYSDVEIDSHKLDCHLKYSLILPTGGRISRFIDRLWVLVAKDRASKAVLSWILVVAREIDHLQLLRCIRRISDPWRPRQISIPKMQYLPGSGLPSGICKHCAGRMVDVIHLDNAMAHLAHNVRYTVKNSIGATLNWGNAGEPNERPLIESFFRTLTEGSIQALPTGFTASKESHAIAMEKAEFLSPTLQEMEDYLDVVLTSFNVCSQAGLYGETPLERLNREGANELIRADVSPEAGWRTLTVVRGTFSIVVDGRHSAHVNFKDAEYTSPSLASMVRRGIKSFEGEYDLEDLRIITPLPIKGWQPDPLQVTKEWATFPHDITLRKLINAEVRAGRFRFNPQRDALNTFNEHLAERAIENKRAATGAMNAQHSSPKDSPRLPVATMGSPKMRSKQAPSISKLGALFPVDISKKN